MRYRSVHSRISGVGLACGPGLNRVRISGLIFLLCLAPVTASGQGTVLIRKILLLQTSGHILPGSLPADSRFDSKGPPPQFVISKATPWAADLAERTGLKTAAPDSVPAGTGLVTVQEPVVGGTTATLKVTWLLKGWFRKDAGSKTRYDQRDCNFIFTETRSVWQLTRTICTVS